MQFLFDYFNQYEVPVFTLCNPSKQELYTLGQIFNRKIQPRYNALSSLSFDAPYSVEDVLTPYYDY